jgi:hypothetical protein
MTSTRRATIVGGALASAGELIKSAKSPARTSRRTRVHEWHGDGREPSCQPSGQGIADETGRRETFTGRYGAGRPPSQDCCDLAKGRRRAHRRGPLAERHVIRPQHRAGRNRVCRYHDRNQRGRGVPSIGHGAGAREDEAKHGQQLARPTVEASEQSVKRHARTLCAMRTPLRAQSSECG